MDKEGKGKGAMLICCQTTIPFVMFKYSFVCARLQNFEIHNVDLIIKCYTDCYMSICVEGIYGIVQTNY